MGNATYILFIIASIMVLAWAVLSTIRLIIKDKPEKNKIARSPKLIYDAHIQYASKQSVFNLIAYHLLKQDEHTEKENAKVRKDCNMLNIGNDLNYRRLIERFFILQMRNGLSGKTELEKKISFIILLATLAKNQEVKPTFLCYEYSNPVTVAAITRIRYLSTINTDSMER